jgi:hypothetical protein
MRLTHESDTADVREALIEQDMDNLSMAEIGEIAADNWEAFEPLIRSHLEKRWADRHDVWLEAEDRGYFEQGAD